MSTTVAPAPSLSPGGEAPAKEMSFKVSAPGKFILYGEHSVVHDKLALAASLELRTELHLVEETPGTHGNILKICLPCVNFEDTFSLQEIKEKLCSVYPLGDNNKWFTPKTHPGKHQYNRNKVATFLEEQRHFDKWNATQKQSLTCFFYLFVGVIGPLDISFGNLTLTVESGLVLGAGTGSSASFSVCVAAAMVQYLKIKTGLNGLDEFNAEELELISSWSYEAEQIVHLLASGIDNTVCTYGSLVEYKKKTVNFCKLNYRFRILLINTNVSRDTKVLVGSVRQLKERYPTIVDPILDSMDEIAKSALHILKKIDETSKVSKEIDTEYFCKLGELADLNQGLLSALGVSHRTLDHICEILRQHGLHGKLTGAGGGGYAYCFISPDVSDTEIELVKTQLSTSGYDPILTNLGVNGVRLD